MLPKWVLLTAGVPIVANFATTDGSGTPIAINSLNGQAYYLAPGEIVAPIAGASWVNVKSFGATGDGVTDDSAAFVNALAYLKSVMVNIQPGINPIYGASGQLFVPAGKYYMGSTTLDITHTLIIEGEGGQGFGAGYGVPTMLFWDDGVTGIRAQAYNTSGASTVDAAPYHFSAGTLHLKGLYLYGGFAGTESESHGVHAKTPFILEDCQIENWPGDALYMHCSVGSGSPNEGNANTSRATNCHFRNSRTGVSVAGGDTNAGIFVGCWFDFNRTWGVKDNSQLGNNYVGCHADGNGITSYSAALGASIVSFGGNRYVVKNGQEAGASANAPSGGTTDNTWWFYQGAGAASGTAIPNWSGGMAVRAGGAYTTDNGTGAGTGECLFSGCYSESGQGFSQFAYPAMVLDGLHGAGIKGYCARLYNDQGWLRLGTNVGRGLIVDGSSQFFTTRIDFNSVALGGAFDAYLDSAAGQQNGFHFLENGVEYAYILRIGSALYINASNSHQYRVGNNTIAQLTGNGYDLASGKALYNNGTQVLGARKTGWGAPTGTATRTTFATSTVTLQQLAERVKALIDDFTSHGAIGA